MDRISDKLRSDLNEYLDMYYVSQTMIYDEYVYDEFDNFDAADESDGFGEFEYTEAFDSADVFKEGNLDDTDLPVSSLEEMLGSVGETFCEMLFRKIDEKGLSDSEVYKKADIDRKLFSKIRNNPAYHPQKNTVIALALALELPIDAFTDMLARAEYALSPSSKGDMIVKFFVEHGVYDLMTINFTLDEYGEEIIGSR